MAQSDTTSKVPPPSPEGRRIAAELFNKANHVNSQAHYGYAVQLLLNCCRLDPANLSFRQKLRQTQKLKYNNNLRGSRLAFLTTIRTRAKLKNARRTGDHLKVLEYGELILSQNPWDLGTQKDMSASADALGLLDMAIFILDQARQKYQFDPAANRALARLFEKRGFFTHAIRLWQLVLKAVPKDLEAAHKAKDLAASETIQQGGYEGAVESSDPSKPKTAPTAAAAKKEDANDRLNRETAPLLARLETDPTEAQLYLQLAQIYRRANQLGKAREILEKGLGPTGNHFQLQIELQELDLQPLRAELHKLDQKIALAAKKTGDEDDDEGPSLEDLKRTRAQLVKEITSREIDLLRIKADRFPQDLNFRLDLGIRFFQTDQIDQAIAEFQLSRKDPKLLGKSLAYLGFCFKKRNNWRLAQRNFEESLQSLAATEEATRKEILYQLARGHADAGEYPFALDRGHELANLDYGYRDIGKLLEAWQEKV